MNNLSRRILLASLLAFGTQSFARMACEGTVYFKKPDEWKTAAVVASAMSSFLTESTKYPGWMEISTADIGQSNSAEVFYIEENGKNDCQSGHCATKKHIDVIVQQTFAETFSCSDFGSTGELWIMAHPDPEKKNEVLITNNEPVIRNFYVFVPTSTEWQRSVPMITTDGGKTGEALKVVEGRCGWFVKRFIGEEIPSNVLIYREDDSSLEDALGLNGNWETAASPTPIDLNSIFEVMEADDVYFVMDEEFVESTPSMTMGWSVTDPVDVSANCGYNLATIIYDTDGSLNPMFSCYALVMSNGCPMGSLSKSEVEQYDAYVDNCAGVVQGIVQDTLGADGKPHLSSSANAKKCFPDEKHFSQLFNYTKGVNEMSSFDIPFARALNGRWKFDSDYYQSPGTKTVGGFFPVEQTTDALVLATNPDQTPLPAARTKRRSEGPAPMAPFAREIDSEEGFPLMDIICNGPGWNGGKDCQGASYYGSGANLNILFGSLESPLMWGGAPTDFPEDWTFYKDGSETVDMLNKQSPRWSSDPDTEGQEGRNQHFCLESHAKFVYKPGLKFSIRGDEDIWVFIDNKLAVDLGGLHLAAPGYVVLDDFKGKSGAWVNGQSYPIDIFLCDRRTTMSDVTIETNMFFSQTCESGLSKQVVSKKEGVESYQLVYTRVGDGVCGSAIGNAETSYVGDALCSYLKSAGKTVKYSVVTAKGDVVVSAEEMSKDAAYLGGIDLTHRCEPVINKSRVNGLPPNTYYLVATAEGLSEKFEFKITGNLNVATKTAKSQDEDGNVKGTYEFTSLAMASTDYNPSRIPLYISSVMDAGDFELLDMGSAIGQTYTLEVLNASGSVSSDVTLEYKNAKGKFVAWDGKTERTIGEAGVDTIYASVPLAMLSQSEQSYKIGVTGRNVMATITFFAPKLVFVEDSTSTVLITGDDGANERWTGSIYNFYLLALAPVEGGDAYEPCGDRCNFRLNAGSATSAGIVVDDASLVLVNGRATISMYCVKEYRIAGDGAAANPASLSITGPSSIISASYTPLFFRNAPVAYPVFADIFDVHGKKPAQKMKIDDEYFSMEQEYLDGIADSLVVYYSKPFFNHPDSIPNRIVVFWDDDSVVVTKEQLLNSILVCGKEAGLDDTLCLGRISVGGVEFSKEVKTASPNAYIKSYATFMDRGRKVAEVFPANINDRVAPVIKSASLVELGADFNKLVLKLSEEVKVPDYGYAWNALTMFLNSVKSNKFVEKAESPVAIAVAGDMITIQYPSLSEWGLAPQVGDYVRLRADKPVWVDDAPVALGTDKTLRPEDDSSYHWNSPTSYDSEKRLPSPWVVIEEGSAADMDSTDVKKDDKKDYDEKDDVSDAVPPSFRVVLTGPFTFDIVFVDAEPGKTKSYAVMDLMGGVIKQGKIVGGTRISVKNSGSYIVRVGRGYQKVDIK